MLKRSNCIIFCCYLILITCIFSVEAKYKLKTIELSSNYRIRKDQLSLSGFSGGAGFAHLFHIIYSELFVGVGIFAGFEYESKEQITSYEKEGLIDKLKFIKNDKVYIWAGTNDSRSRQAQLHNIVEIYEPLLNSPLQLFTKVQFSPHHTPSGYCSNSRNSKTSNKKHIENIGYCFYNGHFHMFQFIYGRQILPGSRKPYNFRKNLYKFDQTRYFPMKNGSGMAHNGLIYIPEKCKRKLLGLTKCYLHLSFHGCGHGASKDGKNIDTTIEYVLDKKSWLNILSIAEKNNIIVVFPICHGCFAYYKGKHDENYGNKKSIKVQIVRQILKKLIGK